MAKKAPVRRGPDHEREYEQYEDDTVDVHPMPLRPLCLLLH